MAASGISTLPESERAASAYTAAPSLPPALPPSAAKKLDVRLRSWVSPLAGLLLLAATIYYVDAGALTGRVSQLRFGYILLGAALALPQLYCLAARWRMTTAQLGLVLTQRRALREYALSMLLNQLLPFGVAGDALRIVRHARRDRRSHSDNPSSIARHARSSHSAHAGSDNLSRSAMHDAPGFEASAGGQTDGRPVAQCSQPALAKLAPRATSAAGSGSPPYAKALYGVLLERLMGQLVVILWALAALPLWFGSTGAWLAAAALLVMSVMPLALRRLPLPSNPSSRPLAARAVLRLAAAVQRLLASPRFVFAQFGLSTAVVLSLAAQLYCALCALGLSLPLLQVTQVFPLMLLSMAVPISFAGFGPREAVTAQLYRALQLSAADGAAFAMATGAVMLCASLPCLLLVLCIPAATEERSS